MAANRDRHVGATGAASAGALRQHQSRPVRLGESRPPRNGSNRAAPGSSPTAAEQCTQATPTVARTPRDRIATTPREIRAARTELCNLAMPRAKMPSRVHRTTRARSIPARLVPQGSSPGRQSAKTPRAPRLAPAPRVRNANTHAPPRPGNRAATAHAAADHTITVETAAAVND